MSPIRPAGPGPVGEPARPIPQAAPRASDALPQDRLEPGRPPAPAGLAARPAVVPRPAAPPPAPPQPPRGSLALFRDGQEILRTPIDPSPHDRVEGAPEGRKAFLSGHGSAFLVLAEDGSAPVAVQAPAGSRIAYARHDPRSHSFWLRTNREVLVVDDRDGSLRGRHAYPKEGFQRRIHPGPDGSMIMLEDGRALTLNPDASVRSAQDLPWNPSWLAPVGKLLLAGNGYPGRLSALRNGTEVPLSEDTMDNTAVADASGATWFLEGQKTPNGPKTLVRVDPETLECRRLPAGVDARRLLPLPDGRLLVYHWDPMGDSLELRDPDGQPVRSLSLGPEVRAREIFVSGDGGRAFAMGYGPTGQGHAWEHRLLALDLAGEAPPRVLWAAPGNPPPTTVLPDGSLALLGEAGPDVVAFDGATRHFDRSEDLAGLWGDPPAADWSWHRPDGVRGRLQSLQETLGERAFRTQDPSGGGWRPLGTAWTYDPADGCLVHRRELSAEEGQALEAFRAAEERRQEEGDPSGSLGRLFERETVFPGLPGLSLQGDARNLHLHGSPEGGPRLLVGVPAGVTLTSSTPINCSGRPFVAVTDSRGTLYWVDASSSSAGQARFHAPLENPRLLVESDRLVGFGSDGSTLVFRPTLSEGRTLLGPAGARLSPTPERAGEAGTIEEGHQDVRIGGISLPKRG